MKKRFLIPIALLATIFALMVRGQISQFGQATYLVCPTNSGVLVTTVYSVQVPAISLTINATNNFTVVTNYLGNSLFVGGTNLFVGTTFIYNAQTMGTNFSTNFAAYTLNVTNYSFGQAVPQSGGSNACSIK